MGRGVGTFGYRGRAHFGELWGNVDPTGFKLTNVSGGRMKRNLLLSMAAAGLWLLASAPAFAACPAGSVGTQLAAGLWTIKIEGFAVDTNSAATDPDPVGEGCFGVIQSDGACDITGGDVICAFNNTITSPTTVSGVPAFAGTVSSSHDVGTYSFNTNNTGQIAIVDTPSGKTMAFGVVAGLGNAVFQGASIWSNAGSSVHDPLILTIQKRDQTISSAQFEDASTVAFDPAGGSAGGNGLGKGFDAINVANEQHLDPETGTTVEGGGTIFFNVDGGYDSDIAPGQLFPSSLVCDFHTSVLALNTGAGQDGTELTNASLNSDYSCPLSGAAFETAAVLYGSTNGSAYVATTGSAGAPAHGLAIANGTRAIMAGSDQGTPETLVQSASTPNPTKTATITNKSTEPLDWTSITVNGVPSVTITGGTCNTAGGDLPAWNPVASPTPPTCTITFTDTGSTCNTGAGKETGTYEIVGADHAMISGTATSTGVTFALVCE